MTIYSEKFLTIKLESNYYKPSEIMIENLEKYNIQVSEDEKKIINSFYKQEISEVELREKIRKLEIFEKEFLESFKYINTGFTFTDLFILENENKIFKDDILGIKNNNELLLTFYKYRIDQRKIPCPDCGGLEISGNSYPEIGHRSWECKNIICPSRSKSNRGKRYSEKTNFMQWGYEDRKDVIEKEFIKKWRKDIVRINNDDEIYQMLIKYYTFSNENVLLINSEKICPNNLGRKIAYLDTVKKESLNYYTPKYLENPIGIYDNFFYKSFFMRNIFEGVLIKSNENEKIEISENKVIHGDSLKILQKLMDNSIDSMVTSPPYYNAREYSQWDNLYLYDMYNIIRESYRVIKPNGVFLYNIGDINSNERIISKSLMGEKRVPLGAYSILLFEKAGFELMENIIWDKGETQSNRHKNDGKFTPHYQRPINSYEHMFIFKKKNNINKDYEWNNCSEWSKNIVQFSPVIKINSKGENKHGHTAPYPEDIPDFVCRCFNKKGNIILDPFLGSGTSIISAIKNNMIGIGIELSKEYVDLANQRIIEE